MTSSDEDLTKMVTESGLVHLLAYLAESSGRAVGCWVNFTELRNTDPQRAMDNLVDLDILLHSVLQPNVAVAHAEVRAVLEALDHAGSNSDAPAGQ